MVTTVRVSDEGGFREFRSRAEDVETLGRIVTRVVETQSQRSFLEQRLGEFKWPERYPSMEDPFVNVAAVVRWTAQGGEILPRFFDRRPALMGQGDLMQSISGRVRKGFVEVGSNLDYAATHQFGGTSSQPITSQAKTTIGRFIGYRKERGEWKPNPRAGKRQKANRDKFFFRLFPILGRDTLETQVNERPFVGITPDNDREIAESIEDWIAFGEGS